MAVNEISVSKIYVKSGEPSVAVSNRFWFDLDSNTLKRYDDTTSSWKPITISPNDIAILNNGETTSLSEYLNTIVEGLFDIDTRVDTLSAKLNNTQPILSSYSEQINGDEDGCNYVTISAYGNAEEGARIDINATNINHYTSDVNINAIDDIGKSTINVNGAFGITITTNPLDYFVGDDRNIIINSANDINLSANHNIFIDSTELIQISGTTQILGDTRISNGYITLESESSSNYIHIHNSGISVTTDIAGESYFIYNGKEVATVDRLPSVYREIISIEEDVSFDYSSNTIVNIAPTTYNSTINIGHAGNDGEGGGAHSVNINAYSYLEGDTTITLSAYNTYNTAEVILHTTNDNGYSEIDLHNNTIKIDSHTINILGQNININGNVLINGEAPFFGYKFFNEDYSSNDYRCLITCVADNVTNNSSELVFTSIAAQSATTLLQTGALIFDGVASTKIITQANFAHTSIASVGNNNHIGLYSYVDDFTNINNLKACVALTYLNNTSKIQAIADNFDLDCKLSLPVFDEDGNKTGESKELRIVRTVDGQYTIQLI